MEELQNSIHDFHKGTMNQSSSSSSSCSVYESRSELPHLHGDLIIEIISRLSVDEVLESKLVCKAWLSMISSSIHNSIFIEKQLHHQLLQYQHFHDHKFYPSNSTDDNNTKIGFVVGIQDNPEEDENELSMCYKEYNEGEISISKRIINSRFYMGDMFIDSRNGLICLALNVLNNPVLYVCNPVTRECVYLQEFASPEPISYQVFGFGYDYNSKKYKAVRVVYQKTENGEIPGGLVQIYTLGRGSGWRDVGTIVAFFEPLLPAVFVDGALHWLDSEEKVWALDLVDEKFCLLTVSHHSGDVHNLECRQELVVLGGWLSALEFHPDGVQIRSFKKLNEGEKLRTWSEEYSIEYENDYFAAIGLTNMGKLLCAYGREQICLCDKDAGHLHDLEETLPIYFEMLHVNSFVSLSVLEEKDVKVIEEND